MAQGPENESDILKGARLIAGALRALGTADAATPFGAIEAHSISVKEAGEQIAGGLNNVADAIDRFTEAVIEQGTKK
jgi:hypothetical protein